MAERPSGGRRLRRPPAIICLLASVILISFLAVGKGNGLIFAGEKGKISSDHFRPKLPLSPDQALRETLLDITQQTRPYPVVIAPTTEPNVETLASAVIAAKELGTAVSNGKDVTAVLDFYISHQAGHEQGGGDLNGVWLALRAKLMLGGLTRADGSAAARYLRALSPDAFTSDAGALVRLAIISRIAALGKGAQPWSEVATTARELAQTAFEHVCPGLKESLTADNFALIGLAFEATRSASNSCVSPEVSIASAAQTAINDRHLDPTGQQELASLILDGHVPQTMGRKAKLSETASGMLASAERDLNATPSTTCPTDIIRQAADLASAAGGHIRAPAAITTCLDRAIRWQGLLTDAYEPSAMSTFIGFQALRLVSKSNGGERLQSVAPSISWDDPKLSGKDRLILSLSFDPKRVDRDLVANVGGEDPGTTGLGIALLNSAAKAIGSCPTSVTARTQEWINASINQGASPNFSLWAIFAAHSAAFCAGSAFDSRLKELRRLIGQSLANLPHGADDAKELTTAWLQVVAGCLGVTTTPRPTPTLATMAHLVPNSVEERISLHRTSLVDMLADASILSADGACPNLGWLTS